MSHVSMMMMGKTGEILGFRPLNVLGEYSIVRKNKKANNFATWLILPVVICLSQRLSHACLSSSENKVKPRMAHYNSHCLLDLDYPTWITVVILELIHAIKLRPYGTSAFIRPKPIGLRPETLVTLNNWADRMVFVPATYLSSVCLINFRW